MSAITVKSRSWSTLNAALKMILKQTPWSAIYPRGIALPNLGDYSSRELDLTEKFMLFNELHIQSYVLITITGICICCNS